MKLELDGDCHDADIDELAMRVWPVLGGLEDETATVDPVVFKLTAEPSPVMLVVEEV